MNLPPSMPLLLCALSALLMPGQPLLAEVPARSEPPDAILSGMPWRDTDGNVIEAHGGGMLQVGETYYWYGEDHRLGVGNKRGIGCYSSRDLVHWKNEGLALPKEALPEAYRDTGVCERPKVIFNDRSRQYVMWMHLDADDYTHAAAGVAVADRPQGPFRFVRQFRPISYEYGASEEGQGRRLAERTKGNAFRDMGLFKDDDHSAYVVYASENNATLYICRLDADYTDIVRPAVLGQTWIRALPNHWREAPVLFKHRQHYYLLSSGVSGWSPNAAEYAMADQVLGEWKVVGNPCVGYESNKTFRSQSTCVVPAPATSDGAFIYMGDRWVSDALEQSTYVWLPFVIGPGGEIAIENHEKWDASVFAPSRGPIAAPVVRLSEGAPRTLRWDRVPGAAGYRIIRDGHQWRFTSETEFNLDGIAPGVPAHVAVVAAALDRSSAPSNAVSVEEGEPRSVYLDELADDGYEQGWGVLARLNPAHPGRSSIAGQVFERGLLSHSRSSIRYTVGGVYDTFSAQVGRTNAEPDGRVQFRVYGDGRLLYLGAEMTGHSPAESIQVPIKGVLTLELVVTDGGDGDAFDGSLWADAQLRVDPSSR